MSRDVFLSKDGVTLVCDRCEEDAVYAEKFRQTWICEDCLKIFLAVPLPDRDQWLRDIEEEGMTSWTVPEEWIVLNRFQARAGLPMSGFERLIEEVGKYLELVSELRNLDLEPRWEGEH